VARDRKRAKQRRIRGGGAAARRRAGADAAPDAAQATSSEQHAGTPGSIERADLPGSLDHASAEVDEFDAALIRGADGVEAPDPIADSPERLSELEIEAEAEDEGDLSEDELQEAGGRGGGGHAVTPAQASGAPIRGGNRAIGFLRASWAELQRVQWPDRRQVTQATAVVLGFVAIAGLYLGLADYVAKEFVELIL
jgi:preprotein translocase subunit SecE